MKNMSNDKFEKEKIKMTPETGFNLVGIDYFENPGNQLYIVEHFDMYQDALTAKKDRKIQDESVSYTHLTLPTIYSV